MQMLTERTILEENAFDRALAMASRVGFRASAVLAGGTQAKYQAFLLASLQLKGLGYSLHCTSLFFGV